MRLTLITLIVLFITNVNAQILNTKKVRFGKISDMEMTSYAPDPDAKAVVLFDEGELKMTLDQITGRFECRVERHLRIKILHGSATDYANFTFPLEYSTGSTAEETIAGIKGATYNLVGDEIEESKLTKDGIFIEEIFEGLQHYKIIFPQVREGSVIELKYTFTSDYLYGLPVWYFQKEIPVDYSAFRAEIPSYYNYNVDMQGFAFDKLVVNNTGLRGNGSILIKGVRGNSPSGYIMNGSAQFERNSGMRTINFETTIYEWAAVEVPAITPLPYAPHPQNFFFRVDFELRDISIPGQLISDFSRSWDAVADLYLGYSQRPFLNPRNQITDLAAEYAGDASSEMHKAVNIYEGLKNKFNWNRFHSIIPSRRPGDLIDEASATSADLNYLLLSMFRATGLSAQPVLLSTANNGLLSVSKPSLSQFNHVIVLLTFSDSSKVLVDATSGSDVPMSILPLKDLNDKGRVIMDDNTSFWIDMRASASNKRAVQMFMELDTEGTLTGNAKFKYEDYAALAYRREIQKADAIIGDVSESLNARMSNFVVKNFDNIYEDVDFSVDVDASETVIKNNDLLYVKPVLVAPFSENPFKAEERLLPVDLRTPSQHVYVMQLKLAEGLTTEELPEAVRFSLPDGKGSYSLQFAEMNGSIQIIEKLSFKESFFGAEEYQVIRKYIDLVIENEEILLVLRAG